MHKFIYSYYQYIQFKGHKIPKKRQGEICGPCQNEVDNFHCGECADGLECRQHGNPYPLQHNAYGTCNRKLPGNQEGEGCGACLNPSTNFQCGSCAFGLECVQHEQNPNGPQIAFESFGVCRRVQLEGQPCGTCFNPAANNQCGICAVGLECVQNRRNMYDPNPQVPFESFGTCKRSTETALGMCSPLLS